MTAPTEACLTCGGPLTAGRCVRCANQWRYRFVHREVVILVVLIAVTVVTFFVTRRFAASNEALRRQDARAWFSRGERARQAGDLDTAVTALRRAATKDPNELKYRLALARALIAAHQDEAATQLLLELRDQQPEDSETNLELARLEERRGDEPAAGRYFQTAIVGLWKAEQRPAQRQARTEFIEFLLNHGERDRALSELLELETSLPDDEPSQVAAGRMLLASGDARRALVHFARALSHDANDQTALAGAAEAAFEMNDYVGSRRYLTALQDNTARTTELRTLTGLVLTHDPLAPRLPASERRNRLAADLAQVIGHLEACQARSSTNRRNASVDLEPPLAEARALDAGLRASKRTAPDQVDAGFDVVVRGERAADRACGSPDLLDRAILLTARRHGLEDQ